MALLHEATISPRKDELIDPWLRTRSWWDGVVERGPVGDFRLDDRAGEVGIQCFLFGSAGGSILFVPVTYRGAPLDGAEASLIGTMQHSVLGRRWVYDGCGDPVFVATVVSTIRDGGAQAALTYRRLDGTTAVRESSATVRGEGSQGVPAPESGDAALASDEADRTVVRGPGSVLVVARRVGAVLPPGPALIGAFSGGSDLRLATVASSPI